jgi:hypothetical protein
VASSPRLNVGNTGPPLGLALKFVQYARYGRSTAGMVSR